MSCTPQSLMALAKCFICPNHKIRQAVQTYLLCQWAKTLLNLVNHGADGIQRAFIIENAAHQNFTYILSDGQSILVQPGAQITVIAPAGSSNQEDVENIPPGTTTMDYFPAGGGVGVFVFS